MKVLLDTSVLIWWLSEPARISSRVMAELRRQESVLMFSQMSLLEIQIKASLKKLELDFPLEEIPELAEQSGLSPLALNNAAIFTLSKLPDVHRDPFDRLLICEAIQEGIAIVSPDKTFRRYPVKVLW